MYTLVFASILIVERLFTFTFPLTFALPFFLPFQNFLPVQWDSTGFFTMSFFSSQPHVKGWLLGLFLLLGQWFMPSNAQAEAQWISTPDLTHIPHWTVPLESKADLAKIFESLRGYLCLRRR